MFEYIQFNESAGRSAGKSLLLFVLSTCAFCGEAVEFLKGAGLGYRWIATDELPFDLRRKLRNEFVRTFRERMYYPTLVIDGAKVLSGFEIEEWREELELQDC